MLRDILKTTYNLDEVADTLTEGIRFLKVHQLDSAEIRTIDGKNIAKLSLDETRQLKKTLDSSGISVAAIASPLFKWYSGNLEYKKEVDLFGMSPYLSKIEKKEMIQKIIDQACILDTKKVRIFSGLKTSEGYEPIPEEESELLLFALTIAKKNNIQLLLENEPVCYISRIEDYIQIFSSGKYEGLRAWFDIANVYEEGEHPDETTLERLAPYIDYLHIKDSVAPKTHKYTPLGQGYINYKRIFSLLENTIKNPLHLSIETHVKNDKWNASSKSLEYLFTLLESGRTRYAIVGVGRVSDKHIQAIKKNNNCSLIGIFDLNQEKARNMAIQNDCISYTSYTDILNDQLVDVVSICVPHNLHIKLAEMALKKGKRVLCEKPLALTSAELERYIADIDKNNQTHVVFQNKFNPAIKKFYEFEKERLGDPQYISMTLRWWRDIDYYQDWHGDLRVSGGALVTQAIHSLELVTHLTKGAAIRKIQANQLKTRTEITLPDIIVALIEFENGVVCNMEVCLATRESNLESSIFVVGTKGSLKVSGVALSEFVFPQNINSSLDEVGHYYGNGHVNLYTAHSNYCLGIEDKNIKLLTRPTDAMPTIKLIEQINTILQRKPISE